MKTLIRGDGGIYKRGDVWWSYLHGSRMSTGERDEKKAQKWHQARRGRYEAGQDITPAVERTTLKDLFGMLQTDYRMNGRRSLDRMQRACAHLRTFFGESRAKAITRERAKEYAAHRLDEENASRASVNYELGLLKRAFKLALLDKRVGAVPAIDSLRLSNARKGFFTRDELDAVLRYLPQHLHGVMAFAFITGWRIPSEVLKLTWERVDLDAGWVRLEPNTPKNDEGRQFPITPELHALLLRQRECATLPYVFAHHNGKPIRDFHHVWRRACRNAGIDRIPHDLRRTAVRNLIRSGVPQVVAMKLSGHKSDQVFRRYAHRR